MTTRTGGRNVTLRSGRVGIVCTVACLLGFQLVAISVLALNGLNVITGMIALLAIASTLVILFDLPLSTRFDESGVHRSTPLRRHHIDWSEVDRLVRMRRGGLRRPGSATYRGIVALRGNRRTLLVDRTETADQHRDMCGILDDALGSHRYEELVRHRPTSVVDLGDLGDLGDGDLEEPRRSARHRRDRRRRRHPKG